MRFVCITIPERGHLNPILPTLRRLVDRGHDVVVAAARDVSAVVAGAGVSATTVVLETPPPPADFVTSGADFAHKLRDPAWLAAWIETLLIDAVGPAVPAIGRVLDDTAPDVVIADPMVYAAVIAATRRGLPWAGVSSSLNPVTPDSWETPLTATLRSLSQRRDGVFTHHGVTPPPFRVADAVSPWLNVAFSVDAWAPRDAADARDVFAVGAPFSDDDIHGAVGDDDDMLLARLVDKPRVYASFGSQVFFQPALFGLIFQAAQRLGLQLIASVGDLVDDDAFVASAPNDAILFRYAPQLRIVPLVDVVISHGGANSVVETCRAGRPLVLIPLCNDQHLQARFVDNAGVGVVVDPDHATVDVVGAAITAALGPAPRAAAAAIGQALREAGGPDRAADLLEHLGRQRRAMSAAVP